MSDEFQVGLVTAITALAFIALVRPYLRRSPPGGDAPCPKCASSNPCEPAADSASPVRLVRSGDVSYDGAHPAGQQNLRSR
jgi:hypothetical protein